MAEENKNKEERNDLLDKYFKQSMTSLKEVDNLSPFAQYYYNACNSGENRFYQKNITETKFFDEEWISTMEVFFPSIDKIIKNPKRNIRYEQDVVAVERAKKINGDSVRHLASHTEYIKDIKDGMVTPSKILTTYTEEDLDTYENRFLKTLIERLHRFVKTRYEIIKDNVESFQSDHLYYTSNFNIKDEKVSLQIDLNIKRDLDNPKINQKNISILQRTERLMIQVSGFEHSEFMHMLEHAKKVHAPIMKTNIILKNNDFRNAYNLWLFLDKYNSLGYDIDVRERPVRLSREFKSNLDRISALTYSGLLNNKRRRKEDFTDIEQIEPIIKKSTKIAKTNPKDIVKSPDAIIVEDNSVNEYYLSLNKKVFNAKVKVLTEEKLTTDAAYKKAIKDSINITNAMFDDVFNLEEEQDYFRSFVDTVDPNKLYALAKTKARIAKMIREAKEQDYKKSVKLEKALYKEMLTASNQKIRIASSQKKDAAYQELNKQIEKDLANLKRDKARLKEKVEILDGKVVDIETGKTSLQQELLDTKEASKQAAREAAQKEKAEFNAALSRMKKEHEESMAKIKDEMAKELEAARKRKQERIAKNKEKIKQAAQKEKEKQKEKNKELLKKQKEAYKSEEKAYKESQKNKIAQMDKESK